MHAGHHHRNDAGGQRRHRRPGCAPQAAQHQPQGQQAQQPQQRVDPLPQQRQLASQRERGAQRRQHQPQPLEQPAQAWPGVARQRDDEQAQQHHADALGAEEQHIGPGRRQGRGVDGVAVVAQRQQQPQRAEQADGFFLRALPPHQQQEHRQGRARHVHHPRHGQVQQAGVVVAWLQPLDRAHLHRRHARARRQAPLHVDAVVARLQQRSRKLHQHRHHPRHAGGRLHLATLLHQDTVDLDGVDVAEAVDAQRPHALRRRRQRKLEPVVATAGQGQAARAPGVGQGHALPVGWRRVARLAEGRMVEPDHGVWWGGGQGRCQRGRQAQPHQQQAKQPAGRVEQVGAERWRVHRQARVVGPDAR